MVEKGFCQCGCGAKTSIARQNRPRFGWVIGEPLRFILNHDKRKFRDPWDVDPVTGCWIWKLCLGKKGYGNYGGRLAHLVIYEKFKGAKPPNTTLDHTCRVRKCVNPDHLEPVPHRINCHRGLRTKITTEDVLEIRALIASGVRSSIVAKRFGIARDYARSVGTMHNRVLG